MASVCDHSINFRKDTDPELAKLFIIDQIPRS